MDASIPTEEPPQRSKAKNARQRRAESFRAKKNSERAVGFQASNLRRLRIADPTLVSSINLQSAIVTSRIPITFRGLVPLLYDTWARMISIGTRPFGILATEANFAIFSKIVFMLAEAKLCYAHQRCDHANFELTSLNYYNEMELRVFRSLSIRLPYPLVIYLDSIGNFKADGQSVIPVLQTHGDPRYNGAVSFSPLQFAPILETLAKQAHGLNAEVYTVCKVIDELPGINWERTESPPTVRLDAASRALWNHQLPTPEERRIFQQIVSSMDSKKGFNLDVDISTGDGSIVQAIRFPNVYDPQASETLYYTNTAVPTYEEQLAPALLLGFERTGLKFSRFCSTYDDCLKHGSASCIQARNAVVWADRQ